MKRLLTVALAVFSLCGLNVQATPAEAPARAAAESAALAEFNKALSNLEGIGTTLAGIHDRASADAAVPKLQAYKVSLDNVETDIDEAMAGLTDDEQKSLAGKMISIMTAATKQIQRLEEEAYYGSPTLAEFLLVDLSDELN